MRLIATTFPRAACLVKLLASSLLCLHQLQDEVISQNLAVDLPEPIDQITSERVQAACGKPLGLKKLNAVRLLLCCDHAYGKAAANTSQASLQAMSPFTLAQDARSIKAVCVWGCAHCAVVPGSCRATFTAARIQAT